MQSLALFAQAAPMSMELRLPLSIMNFLEFAIWGAWFVVLGQYLNALNFSGKQIGSIYATMALGSTVTPILFGAAADKFIASEVLMGILHLAGAGLLLWMAYIREPRKFYWVALVYALVYSPTLTLSNSVIFSHIPDAQRDFPSIRVLGTIGWIAANLFLKVLLKPGEPVNNRPLLLAATLSAVLGVYSFMLPHTPPKEAANPIDALKLLKETSFAIFFGISLLITVALAFYYSFTSLFLEQKVKVRSDNVGPLMTIGQWMEIFFLAGIPWLVSTPEGTKLTMEFGLSWFLDNFGMRTVLIMGMAAWAIRYAIFTAGGPFPLIILGLAVHGICYDFFFAAGFIFVEQTASADIRGSAQGLFGTLTYGLGMYIGNEASGWLNQWCTTETVDPQTGQVVKHTNWTKFWLAPCIGVLICLGLFVALFDMPK